MAIFENSNDKIWPFCFRGPGNPEMQGGALCVCVCVQCVLVKYVQTWIKADGGLPFRVFSARENHLVFQNCHLPEKSKENHCKTLASSFTFF